jgi:hypothetical protein
LVNGTEAGQSASEAGQILDVAALFLAMPGARLPMLTAFAAAGPTVASPAVDRMLEFWV